jgi:hypothetical protein
LLASLFSAEYPAEDMSVETSLILPRFRCSNSVLKSTPKIVNSGLPTRYRVGNTARFWPEQNEEREVSVLYFNADSRIAVGGVSFDGWQDLASWRRGARPRVRLRRRALRVRRPWGESLLVESGVMELAE